MKRFAELDSEAFCRSAARRIFALQLLFVALVALLFAAAWAGGERVWLWSLAGFLALLSVQAVTISWLMVGVRKKLLSLEGERDAFYQELLRLSAFSSLGEISSSIAHDLNNPLAIMNEEVGWIQDLLQGQDPSGPHALSEYANSAVQIRLQIQRSAEITRRILSWSREGEENRQLVDLNVLLNKTLVLLESDLSSARISVTKELDPRLPPVSGNLPELRQVFLHLTKNALDAMKDRGGVLTIATESRGDLVRASIRDTGPGIPKDLAKSIFSPFFTTKPAGEGTGVGLSISAWIVKRLGGKIEVESEPGAGSSFHVLLPASPAPPQEENPR